ncbi:MAG: S8 family serine peptidase [Leptolyngbya sp. Prado105]|jgi:subtilisin family serine protease|nr:S8 family serine peptidase [Leptolyngbya sp. Prado105]
MFFSQASNALDIVSSLFTDSASQASKSQLDCGFTSSRFRPSSHSEQTELDAGDITLASQACEGFTSSSSESVTSQIFPASHSFSPVYGYGLVDAAAAVAASIGRSRFADVADQYHDLNLWGLDAVSAPEVWNAGYTGRNVVVAVIDSGVDFTHSDLNDNIWINQDEILGNGIDDDYNGYVDDLIGWDFVSGDNNPMDFDGHGTHVAGTIAAERNGAGIIGVAFDAEIMPIRVLGETGGADLDIAEGIVYAANNGANVINLSLGGSSPAPEIAQAIQYATERGAMVVMSAGNNGQSEPGYPGYYAKQWGVAVGAIDEYGYMADTGDWASNLAGNDPAMRYIVAPGVNVYSTIPNDEYEAFGGTSMAAPHVAGVAALMLSANPDLSPAQLRQILIQTTIS